MDIDASVIADFRAYYPEFSDTSDWPDATLERYLWDATQETGSSRWGSYSADPAPNFKARGLFAYAAHRAAVARAAQRAMEAGGTPSAPARAESKSVGDESVTYAVHRPDSGARMDSVGDLNTTVYGQEFLRLRNRAAMGAATTGGRVL